MSASPFFNIATRVVPSGTLLMTRRLIDGTLRQYTGYASSTTSTPGVWLTNLYGPAPMGFLRNPSSPTCVTYFFGTTSPAAVALVLYKVMKSGHGSLSSQRIVGESTTSP